MILDNENSKLKVHEWLKKYTETGEMSVVTGYFTVGALVFLAEIGREKIQKYRFILGDIVHFDAQKIPVLNLLNENLSIDNALKMKKIAQEAVAFLQLESVQAKTLEPNFCHAKLYLHTSSKDERFHYFISGSANLTEAGIGLKQNSNVELNLATTGDNTEYQELLRWFNDLWQKPQAHFEKTIEEEGKKKKMNFKEYLIKQISRLFVPYEPKEIYFKILYSLFKQEEESPSFKQAMGKLENTHIFSKLYQFQKAGVHSLISMLEKYNGAILADAVGLGKTWSALAVMKYYQMKGFEVILLCPKKLEQNWRKYLKRNQSLFEEDKLDYIIRFHTDLRLGGLEKNKVHEDFFTNDKPKLFVIDESHNLRNSKSTRYNYLVENVLKKSQGEIKMLLLSATPINNSFKDVRNQFGLLVKGENAGFAENLEIKNLEHTFREVQTIFNKWTVSPNPKLADFNTQIKDSNFFKLTDNLLVARTRKNVQTHFEKELVFPQHKKPLNIFETPLQFGDTENFADLLENMQLTLSAYQPAFYTLTDEERKKLREKSQNADVLKDEVQRQFYLVKMMMILILKRLESSWFSFKITIERIHEYHKLSLEKIEEYEKAKKEIGIEVDIRLILWELEDEEELGILDNFELGKKNPISLKKIDAVGMLAEFKKDIKRDKRILKGILTDLEEFERDIRQEKILSSKDTKLQKLLEIIQQKQKGENKKIVIFSAYKDSVQYLFNELKKRGFQNFAMISGEGSQSWNENEQKADFEPILQRFAPYTKLYKEQNWRDFSPTSLFLTEQQTYQEWQKWIEKQQPKTHEKLRNPIEILIATDVLSEGQNMQDADMVVNYDVHWNPVRIIQRFGRIDRIGSPNKEIQCINFWPAKDIDDYINLQKRVEQRMAIMKLAGSEVMVDFTPTFAEMAEDKALEARQKANMMRQMESSLQGLDEEKTLGFDDFSFDNYRQLLQEELNKPKKALEQMPNAVFSGFKLKDNSDMQKGLIALLGFPAQKKYSADFHYKSHHLIYIDFEGNLVSNNQKIILDQLAKHYKEDRYVPEKIESADTETLAKLSNALRKWADAKAKNVEIQEDGTQKELMNQTQLDFIKNLQKGKKSAMEQVKNDKLDFDKYDFDKLDLVAWFVVSEDN